MTIPLFAILRPWWYILGFFGSIFALVCIVFVLPFLRQALFTPLSLWPRLALEYALTLAHVLYFAALVIGKTWRGRLIALFILLWGVLIIPYVHEAALVSIALIVSVLAIRIIKEDRRTQRRWCQPEMIDLGMERAGFTLEEYHENLQDMARIAGWFNDYAGTLGVSGFGRLASPPGSVLDVGCGAGFYTAAIAQALPQAQVRGIDTSTRAIEFAQRQHAAVGNVRFEGRAEPELEEEDKSVDVVTCCLMTHHIPQEDQLVEFLRRAVRTARQAVIINDLDRDAVGVVLFSLFVFPVTPNRLTQHDGVLSVRRAYKKREWEALLAQAGIGKGQYTITWRWFSRWIIFINAQDSQ